MVGVVYKSLIKKITICIFLLMFSFTSQNAYAGVQDQNKNIASSIYENNVQSILYVQTQDSSGSGVIVDEDGTFVTCFHVIANADVILAQLEDGSIYEVNGFKYINPLTDIAILTLNTTRKFRPVKLNNVKKIKVGEDVYSISNPQGLQFVFSNGIISQSSREYIQFSAPISAGSSGGALLNKNGKLIGIITSQLMPSEAQNINFALPIEYFISHIKNSKIVNDEDLNWTEFLVDNADEEQFKVYAEYALNESNYGMFYKYLKPFIARTDVPEDLYPKLGVFALYAYLYDGVQESLSDAINYFQLAYEKQQNEEACLYALSILINLGDISDEEIDNELSEYLLTLFEKYPNSFNKISEIFEKTEKCAEDDEDCMLQLFSEYMDYLIELVN